MDDQAALRALVERYAEVVDARTFERLGEVFVADAVLETGNGTRNGLAEIEAAMQGLHRYDRTAHLVGDSAFEMEGDTTHGRVECVAHHWRHEGGSELDRVMEITYHDSYEHTPDGWRLRHRRLEIHRNDETVVG